MIFWVAFEALAPMSEPRKIFCRMPFVCLSFYIRKLKELPKRTTFIRVTQQINEVFGTAPPATADSQISGFKRTFEETNK